MTDSRIQRGPSAWRAADLAAEPARWSFDLGDFCDAGDLTGASDPGQPVINTDVVARDLPRGFPAVAAEVRRRLFEGAGFVVIRGFPVGADRQRRAVSLYAWLIAQFGGLVPQNTAGDDLYLVRTKGLGADRQYGSRGSGELLFHTDQAAAPPELLPAVLGLLCLDRAGEGGYTRLVSGHALLNDLLDVDPSLVDALTAPAPFGRENDGVSDAPPVIARPIGFAGGGRAKLRYNRFFCEVGAAATGRTFAPDMVAAFDAIDELFDRGHLPHQVLLQPGDALIADNSVVMHNRSAYVDDHGHQRCLVRAWAH
jgi:hypothetical protein